MNFSDLRYLFLLLVFFFIYWLIPYKYASSRKWLLLFFSLILYFSFNPFFFLILFWVIAATYFGGLTIDAKRNRRRILIVFLVLTLVPLLMFKYYNFINGTFVNLLSFIGCHFSLTYLSWIAPIGISFFTFQALGYLIDVYRGETTVEKNFFDYCLFISFFPQIVAGPISKAKELLPQMKSNRAFDYNQVVGGFRYLLWGLFLKLVVADRANIIVSEVFSHYQRYSGAGCILACFIYSIQIYADFLGYSTMAIGAARILGFNIIENFRRPYFSSSITDFWHRWHISLSRWLKDYVYISLGGNRCSRFRVYVNLFVTFIISGLWHGANWTFILWGGIHGVFLILEKVTGWVKREGACLERFLKTIITFVIVSFAWILFRSVSITSFFSFISHFKETEGRFIADKEQIIMFCIGFGFLFSYEIILEFTPKVYSIISGYRIVRWGFYLLLVCLIGMIGVLNGGSFIYATF